MYIACIVHMLFMLYSAAITFYSCLLHFYKRITCFKTGYYTVVLGKYCDFQPGWRTTEIDMFSSIIYVFVKLTHIITHHDVLIIVLSLSVFLTQFIHIYRLLKEM